MRKITIRNVLISIALVLLVFICGLTLIPMFLLDLINIVASKIYDDMEEFAYYLLDKLKEDDVNEC